MSECLLLGFCFFSNNNIKNIYKNNNIVLIQSLSFQRHDAHKATSSVLTAFLLCFLCMCVCVCVCGGGGDLK